MKEGLIQTRVNKLSNLSEKIKEFILEKSAQHVSPFHQEEFFALHAKTKSRAKRSLTDWRQLYNKNQNKIIPRHTVYPATADGVRFKNSMTGQGNRRRVYSTVKSKSFQGERTLETRQWKRQKESESKRQNMMQFAFVQTMYQNQMLKDEFGHSTREKKMYIPKKLDSRREDYCKMWQHLTKMKPLEISAAEVDATQEYIQKLGECHNVNVSPYNLVEIKEQHKLNNSRFLDSLQLVTRRKKTLRSENGLRYYQRP